MWESSWLSGADNQQTFISERKGNMSKIYKTLIYNGLNLVAVCSILIAITFAQQPQPSYVFTNLVAGHKPTPFGSIIDDFASSWANQNSNTITVRVRLVADDPKYKFFDDCDQDQNPNFGTYTYCDFGMPSLTPQAINVFGVSVIFSEPLFQGGMEIQSLGGEAFYIFSPNDFKVNGSGSDCLTAYYNAWQNSSWAVPFFWDEPTQLLISPYGNYWHNDIFWDKGWHSIIRVKNNNSNTTVIYTIVYRNIPLWGGTETPPPTLEQINNCANPFFKKCSSSPITEKSKTITLPPGSIFEEPFETMFGIDTSLKAFNDGFFFIQLSPVVGGTEPAHNLPPNLSGVKLDCGLLPDVCCKQPTT